MDAEKPRYKVQQRRSGAWGILDTRRVVFVADRADREYADAYCAKLNGDAK